MWWHQRKELAQSYNKLVLDLEEKQKNIAHLQQQLGNMKQQNDLQFKQVNELRQVREMQRKALGQLHLKQQQLENQLTTAHTQMETLQQEQRDRERQREQEQGKLRWAESREVNARKEKETLVERIAVLQTELANQTKYLQTQLTAAHTHIQTLQQERRDVERQQQLLQQESIAVLQTELANERRDTDVLIEMSERLQQDFGIKRTQEQQQHQMLLSMPTAGSAAAAGFGGGTERSEMALREDLLRNLLLTRMPRGTEKNEGKGKEEEEILAC